jgi:arylsulfatase A-like enzyme
MPPSPEQPPSDHVVPRRRVSVFPWVSVTIVAFHLALFLISITALTVFASKSDSKFASLALKDYRAYLFMTNIDLLRGYAVVAFGYILLSYPVVRFWTGSKPPGSCWAVIWRTLAVLIGIMAYFWLRLIHSRPYFLTAENFDHWYFQLLTDIPQSLRPRVFFVLFTFLPAVVWFGAAVFYMSLLLRRVLRGWPAARAVWVSFGGCALLLGGWLAAPLFEGNPVSTTQRLSGPPNILILASDSLRADRLSCNGYHRTTSPNIDRLAAESVNCTKMMTPIASTLESMTSIMTSQYPHTHGIQHMYPSKLLVSRALKQSPKLPQILGRHGYKTIVMGDWCAGIFNVMPLGFDHVQASDFDDFKLYMAEAVYMAHFIIPLYFDNDFGYWMFPRLPSFANYVTPDLVTERLTERLDREAHNDQPFFIQAFYSCTHIPYYCPPPYHQLYADPQYHGRNKFRMDFNVDSFVRGTGIEKEFKSKPPAEVQQIRDLYDGCVNFFDDQVGKALASLEENGLRENTIVIIMSDHGDDLFEPNTTFSHGLTFNGGDQTSNLPFILHVPGGRLPVGKVGRLTRTIDIGPTLLDLIGLPPESRFEGTSLRPYLEGTEADLSLAFFGETSYLFFKREVPNEEPLSIVPLEDATEIDPTFNFHFRLKESLEDQVLRTKERCLRTEHWKLVFTPGVHHDIWRLFDLRTDPHCERDIKLQNPKVWHAMETALRRWVDQQKETPVREIFPEGEPAAVLAPST